MKTLLCLEPDMQHILKKNALNLKLNNTQFVTKLLIDFENNNDLTKKKSDIQKKISDIQEKNKLDIQNLEKELLDIQELEKVQVKVDEVKKKEYQNMCKTYAKRIWVDNLKSAIRLCEQNAYRWGKSPTEMLKDCETIPHEDLSDEEYSRLKKE